MLVVANFPANFTRAGRAAAGEHRLQRRPLRRLHADEPRHGPAPAARLPTRRPRAPRPATRIGATGSSSGRIPSWAICRWRSNSRRRPERFTELVRRVGREAQRRRPHRGALRLGRARAVRVVDRRQPRGHRRAPGPRRASTKLQHLQLGNGTSQHVLIAGKTGSGKSTLLHVLITNVALRYSPDEVELYLIDFKKGVEFKAYAEAGAAARARDRHRERAGVRPERAGAARPGAEAPRRSVPRAGRAGSCRASAPRSRRRGCRACC